ncbi:MAG: hypothetical protein AAFY88_26425, partial [Acidobacteriota bacterium]
MVAANSAIVLDAEASTSVALSLGGASMDAAVLVPFSIRGQISGALWAGRAAGGELNVPAVQLLAHAAAMALETASVSPGRSPALDLTGALPQVSEEPFSGHQEPDLLEERVDPPEEALESASPVVGDDSAHEVVETAQAAAFVGASPAADEPGPIEPEPEAVAAPAAEAVEAETDVQEHVEAPQPAERVSEPEGAVEEVAAPDSGDPSGAVAAPENDGEDAPESYVPTEDDIALEAEPEPELEDTNIWELEEEDDEDDEPTQVGMAASVDGTEEAYELESEVAPMEPPVVGQETVRIDLATIQQDQAALAQGASDPGDETSPTMHAVARETAPDPAVPDPAVPDPAVPDPVEPPASSYSAPEAAPPEPSPPASFTSSPSSFVEPV